MPITPAKPAATAPPGFADAVTAEPAPTTEWVALAAAAAAPSVEELDDDEPEETPALDAVPVGVANEPAVLPAVAPVAEPDTDPPVTLLVTLLNCAAAVASPPKPVYVCR